MINVLTVSIQLSFIVEVLGMMRRIFKTGNSIVVSLPKEWLDALRLTEGAEVDLQFDRTRGLIELTPTPVAFDGVDEEFARQLSDFIVQYRPALEALAKG